MSAEHLAAYTAEDVGACADAVNNILGKTLAINPSGPEKSHEAQLRHSRLSIFYVRELAALQPWGGNNQFLADCAEVLGLPHVQYRTDGTPTAPELEEAIQTIYKLSQGTNIDKVGDSLITTLEFYTPDAIDRVMLKKLALQIFNATGLIEYIADSPNCTWYTNKEPVRPLTPFPTAQPGRRAIKPASVWTDPYTHYVLPQLEPVETESRNSKNTVKMSS